ncbi:hypothetical protein BH23GEM11_BH23GEM11_19820 [soil metagenome]
MRPNVAGWRAPVRAGLRTGSRTEMLAGALVLACAGAPELAAQDEGAGSVGARESSVVLTRLPLSLRSLSLGGALPLVSSDPDLFLRNPANAERGRGMGVSMQGWEADARLLVMSAGTSWFGGGVALGVRHAIYAVPGDPPGAGSAPRPAAAGDRMRFVPAAGAEADSVSEKAVTVGYGRLLKGFRVGLAA